jgi:MraZ protein
MGAFPPVNMFRGATELTLDSKGRLVLPTRYRERVAERCGGKLILTIHPGGECLLIYPLPDWEELERKLMRLPNLRPDAQRVQRLLVGHAADIELDGHGRMLLPANLRDFASLSRDAVLIGQGSHFELWDEARWSGRRDEWLKAKGSSTDLPPELESLTL